MPAGGPVAGAVAGQVGLLTQPAMTQANFREMCGEVSQWNPDAPITMVERWIQNAYRTVIDSRLWYGLLVRGELSVPDLYSTGTVTCTADSASVVGVGTAWTTTLVGRQFRIGLTLGKSYTIKSVEDATHLTLDLPWGSATQAAVSYQVFKSLVSFGNNIKLLLSVVNPRQNWSCVLNLPQQVLDQQDPQRAASSATWAVVSHPASSAGEPLWELYPRPLVRQAFPWIGYIQPPDLVNDTDFPWTGIRSDVLVLKAIADAKVFRKDSKYYDPVVAAAKLGEHKLEVEKMARNDDNHYQKDQIWDYSRYPLASGGGNWAQTHDVDC